MLKNGESTTTARIADFWGVIPAITGKIELVYEGEQEGPYAVALSLLGLSVKEVFLSHFPHPEKVKRGRERDPYGVIKAYFSGSHVVEVSNDAADSEYHKALNQVPGMEELLNSYQVPEKECHTFKELVLHALSEFDVISKDLLQARISFSDPLANMLDDMDLEDREDP
jgi:magnesium chelatase subunit I